MPTDDDLRVALQLWRNEPTVRVTAFVNERDVMLPAPELSEKRLDLLVRAFVSEMSRFGPAASSAAPSAMASAQP